MVLLATLWVFRLMTWPSILRRAYHSVLIHLVKQTALFDRDYYLELHGDSVFSGMSPLRHYVTYGDREKRSPMAFFDPDYYRSQTGGGTASVNVLLHYARVGRYRRISPSPWFDVDFYLAVNKDVARAGLDPLLHFVRWGGLEGRSPSPEFDSAYYLRTNPNVARSRTNPLLHYLRVGRLEGRRPLPEAECIDEVAVGDLPQPCIPSQDMWLGLPPRSHIGHAEVDVIVPVYRGRAETLRCLYSVLAASTETLFELVVIEDASPDGELVDDLKQLAASDLFTLLVNRKNRGFIHSVNRGMKLHSKRDVVLLNADTEVFDGWLDRLRQAAWRDRYTATVTPLSNNATICSYPRFLQDNPFPLELSYAELDDLASEMNAGAEVTAPTGVGFCIYIKRAALADVGLFDVKHFGRGYGEENDFCQRAIHNGWRNIIAANIFVHHWGAASFKGQKDKRILAALKTLDRQHPTYQQDVAAFIESDPLRDFRSRIDYSRLMRLRRKKNVLMVCHQRGGGAERHVQEEIQRLTTEGIGVYLMRPKAGNPSHVVIRHPAACQMPNLDSLNMADTTAMVNLLSDLGIAEIHTHSLVDFVSDAPDHLVALKKALGTPWKVNLHDYKIICPRINLAFPDGYYCGEPTEADCDRCLSKYGSDFGVTDISSWRRMHQRALKAADRVLVPDPDAAERLEHYYPEIHFEVSPHESLDPAQMTIRNPRLMPDERLCIVIIGAIGKIKGFDVLLACARHARQHRLPLSFALMGYSMNDRLLRDAGVNVTGRYLEEQAQDTLETLGPHLVWLPSVWPETYSYTLSIALKAGLPVAAFDIGAIARRIREFGPTIRHRLFPLALAKRPERLNEWFVAYRSRQINAESIRQAG